MNKTIKIIDLLNKIVNDEEVPKKIKDQNNIYVFSKDRRRYKLENKPWCFLTFESNKLNDEVEIIKDEDINIQDIEEIINYRTSEDDLYNDNFDDFKYKINDLIKAVKKLDKKLDKEIDK